MSSRARLAPILRAGACALACAGALAQPAQDPPLSDIVPVSALGAVRTHETQARTEVQGVTGENRPPAELPSSTQAQGEGDPRNDPAAPEHASQDPVDPGALLVPTPAPRRIETFRAAFEALARAHPELLEIRSIGHSRGGHDIAVAIVADTRAGDPSRRPALLVCADLAPAAADVPSTARGPEALVLLVEDLIARAGTSGEVATLLRETTIYVVPAPDPDRWFGPDGRGDRELAAPARDVDLDKNFPIDWAPAGLRGGAAGPYPLSEPEARALADFVRARTNVAALLVWPESEPVRALPIEAGTDGRPREPDADARAPQAGSFALFCAELAGARVFREGELGRAARAVVEAESLAAPAQVDEWTRILRDLPRLEVGEPRLERLRANLWVADLTLENRGRLPSVSAALRARWSGPSVWLRVTGVRVVSIAGRAQGASSYEVLNGRPTAWFLGDLAGGARTELRLIVEADENATLQLLFESLRAGEVRASVPLR